MQQLKEIQTSLRKLSNDVTQLQENISDLQAALPAVASFVSEVKRDVKKWQFKTQPRLNRIQIILDVLKIDSDEQKK
ncbi:hypothetical protein [Limosilactobacillus caviae]|uniref:Uncharacterized protein n=1 Tax=Limosilactobacillus caviae TaxID=1769424 RepID=A0ABQ2C8L7_9LACO|nr:hypothetical protein [Limosilactobacillus caviae]MCD7123776.1 hypothetical protein [Limosilactobacillus caviae]MRH46637.1 hypothetical protein [Limosilactobacillus reuteri]NGC78139.1 hypothetical protein [Limosilactobacillus reuteri]GGI63679.1 hypothetical protein GCM10011459_15130 [Limosilactobacillus caviae]